MFITAVKGLLGNLTQRDVDSINSARRFLGYSEAQILRTFKNAKKFVELNDCKVSRKSGDRLVAASILKNRRTIEAWLDYEPTKK
jgi:hypothetical protein